MITLVYSKKFLTERKKFVKHNLVRTRDVGAALRFFVDNPSHPSLQIEKLGGTNIWTIRIDSGNRIFFIWIDNQTAVLIDIGPHDKNRKY